MKNLIFIALIMTAFSIACVESNDSNSANSETNSNATANVNSKTNKVDNRNTPPTIQSNDDEAGFAVSQTGEEKVKPDEGKANVQGKVLYNSQPAADIEVKLCEKLNVETLTCSGQIFKTKTNSTGEFLVANVPPMIYDSLLIRVFDTNLYLFVMRNSGRGAAKYKLESDKTFFAITTHLFKSDINIQYPKPNSQVSGDNFEAKWEPYPNAAYYKITLKALDEANSKESHLDMKIENNGFTSILPPGKYTLKIKAFNSDDTKIAEPIKDTEFTVTSGGPSQAGKLSN